MNVTARLEYELAYYDSAVHHFNHYATRTPGQMSVFETKKLCDTIQKKKKKTTTKNKIEKKNAKKKKNNKFLLYKNSVTETKTEYQ